MHDDIVDRHTATAGLGDQSLSLLLIGSEDVRGERLLSLVDVFNGLRDVGDCDDRQDGAEDLKTQNQK